MMANGKIEQVTTINLVPKSNSLCGEFMTGTCTKAKRKDETRKK